jgi:hypothetical protein
VTGFTGATGGEAGVEDELTDWERRTVERAVKRIAKEANA